ncbi:LLM class F420-dependent oxidoreductase [Myxococcota bacterium]|nr:LLM class F420-dependent oxidoreductase [Myxococcota bacterium]
MRIGLQIPSFTTGEEPATLRQRLADVARRAEDSGFASLWVMDHFFQIDFIGPAEQEMLEGYSTLSYLSAMTERVSLGTLVTGVTYRHPGILAKTATTLDVLSGGRAILGIGAAWFEREHRGLGIPFPPLDERFERLEETLQIVQQMWSRKNGPFTGKHYRLAETLSVPAPISHPRPRILIGGLGERKTLRLVAKYADACNLFDYVGVDGIRSKLEILRRHCEEYDRTYDDIERTTLSTIDLSPGGQSPRGAITHLKNLAGAGVQHAIVNLPDLYQGSSLSQFAREIIPAASEL